MKRILTLVFAFFAFCAFSTTSNAQSNVASHQIGVNVHEIAIISVSGQVSMIINAATAGGESGRYHDADRSQAIF
jgi:hypothetical protein